MKAPAPLLQVSDLHTCFHSRRGPLTVVAGVDLAVYPGEVVALLGESGCGKSATALSLMGLIPPRSGQVSQGQILFNGQDLRQLRRRQLDEVRGRDLAMIFQDPMSALNPVLSIGRQLRETLCRHLPLDAREAEQEALRLLAEVGIPHPADCLKAYPHQLSGGLCQRVMIAMAVCCNPRLLIADEPTTALDVTVQRQVMHLLDGLRRRRAMALLLITHDLGVVAQYADRALVMYLGQVVEQGPVQRLFERPAHPYTRALLASMPDIDASPARLPGLAGQVPDLHQRPVGCAFAARCGHADDRCRAERPALTALTATRQVRCWHPLTESA